MFLSLLSETSHVYSPCIVFQHLPIFKQIIKDVFAGLPEPPGGVNTAVSALSRSYDVETALEKTASEYGLIPHKAWRDKCMQLYSISQVHQGMHLGWKFEAWLKS
jgi:hypothetical protein